MNRVNPVCHQKNILIITCCSPESNVSFVFGVHLCSLSRPSRPLEPLTGLHELFSETRGQTDTTGENISKYLVAHWLLAKETFGRVGLPYSASVNLLNSVNKLYSEIVNNYSKYMRSILFRLNMISKDTKYLKFISKVA